MQMREILRQLDIGKSVAEFDDSLERYFVETEPFRALVEGRADVIAGDKGTGKTAMYRILRKRYPTIPELSTVEVITGFNISGNPVFQRLAQQPLLTESQYSTVWKAYVVSLVGNWLLDLYEGSTSESVQRLDTLLANTGLRSQDDTPQTVFSKITNTISRLTSPRSAELGLTISETGLPVITPKLEFGGAEPDVPKEIPHEHALGLLNRCLADSGLTAWVVLDRLDEAFQGFPSTEIPALRALLRTYLDLLEFDRVKLKLFIRRDLFRKIIRGGFVNLTHVNARKIEIVWDEDDLLNLLCRRIRESPGVIKALGLEEKSDQEVFAALVPEQVDVGERKPTTWSWMMSRIRDGNQIKPPRNLIDLVGKAREAQLRREDREARQYSAELPILEQDSLRRALTRLSNERVEDTLLAEAGSDAPLIERFRGKKAEHNASTLATLLGVTEAEVSAAIKPLVEMGFLEQTGETFKVPMLYRDGLEIVQGKAF
ncbi:MAG: hypothetical protein KJ067_23600 [Vicinamibacteria bacterium]|nr:hypothetical protein [Vicinamibacteria bacterium]